MEELIKSILKNNKNIEDQTKKLSALFAAKICEEKLKNNNSGNNIRETDISCDIKELVVETMKKHKIKKRDYDILSCNFIHKSDRGIYDMNEHLVEAQLNVIINEEEIDFYAEAGWDRKSDYGYPNSCDLSICDMKKLEYGCIYDAEEDLPNIITKIKNNNNITNKNLIIDLTALYISKFIRLCQGY